MKAASTDTLNSYGELPQHRKSNRHQQRGITDYATMNRNGFDYGGDERSGWPNTVLDDKRVWKAA